MNTVYFLVQQTMFFSIPLLIVALGGMFSERSGVVNIALEGMMIIGALFACFTLQAFDQSGFGPAHPQLAMLVAILVAGLTGVIFSFFLGFAAINLKADQTIGGTANRTVRLIMLAAIIIWQRPLSLYGRKPPWRSRRASAGRKPPDR